MAEDVFGNNVGSMLVLKANEASITTGGGGSGFVLNASINYQQNLQPVATFGADTIFALQTPQGTFSVGTVAGNELLKKSLQDCYGTDLVMTFASGMCKAGSNASKFMQEITKNTKGVYTLVGAITNGFQIQGQATDAFFTQNVTGIFHFLRGSTGGGGGGGR